MWQLAADKSEPVNEVWSRFVFFHSHHESWEASFQTKTALKSNQKVQVLEFVHVADSIFCNLEGVITRICFVAQQQ